MSFLAPFYIAGALAVGLPILFHLLRRSPRGRVRFSSLMFLRPSPPRMTRRSRLDNWLLLALRAAALCLLALAFARPFLREVAGWTTREAGRRVAILVDTSASMRRGDLWSRARARAADVLGELGAEDDFALFTFDDRVRTLMSFDAEGGVPVERKAALARSLLASETPSWGATDLGRALVAVAERLEESREDAAAGEPGASSSSAVSSSRALEIVLVTDLQRGSRLDALSAFGWPERVRLAVERVALPRGSNAALELLGSDEQNAAEESRRARVVNEEGSSRDRFSLVWASAGGEPLAEAAAGVHVPPGESRVVSLASPSGDVPAEHLVLLGDDHDFDNTYHIAPPVRDPVNVLYIGDDAPEDASGLRYFVERALESSSRRPVRFEARRPSDLRPAAWEDLPRLVILAAEGGEIDDPLRDGLQRIVRSGGTLLAVVADAAAARSLGAILGCDDLRAEEAGGGAGTYAMLADIDFSHPLFSPFADPRFSDFTAVRFWRHRRLEWDAAAHPDLRVLARFDGGDPAIVEKSVEKGRILVLASGWHPRDSQLALSTKFVPLLAGLLEDGAGEAGGKASLYVGEPASLPPATAGAPEVSSAASTVSPESGASPPSRPEGTATPEIPTASRSSAPARRIRTPDGSEVVLAAAAEVFEETGEPGIYELLADGEPIRFAVNIAPSERRTAPMAAEDLERLGARLGARAEEARRQRQMLDRELESRQKGWRWLIAGVLGILILETWLAGRRARSAWKSEIPT